VIQQGPPHGVRFRRPARARGSSRRADQAKPTKGAGDAAPGGLPERTRLAVAIVAPSVGLSTIQPGGLSPGHGPRREPPHVVNPSDLAPGTNRMLDTQHLKRLYGAQMPRFDYTGQNGSWGNEIA